MVMNFGGFFQGLAQGEAQATKNKQIAEEQKLNRERFYVQKQYMEEQIKQMQFNRQLREQMFPYELQMAQLKIDMLNNQLIHDKALNITYGWLGNMMGSEQVVNVLKKSPMILQQFGIKDVKPLTPDDNNLVQAFDANSDARNLFSQAINSLPEEQRKEFEKLPPSEILKKLREVNPKLYDNLRNQFIAYQDADGKWTVLSKFQFGAVTNTLLDVKKEMLAEESQRIVNDLKQAMTEYYGRIPVIRQDMYMSGSMKNNYIRMQLAQSFMDNLNKLGFQIGFEALNNPNYLPADLGRLFYTPDNKLTKEEQQKKKQLISIFEMPKFFNTKALDTETKKLVNNYMGVASVLKGFVNENTLIHNTFAKNMGTKLKLMAKNIVEKSDLPEERKAEYLKEIENWTPIQTLNIMGALIRKDLFGATLTGHELEAFKEIYGDTKLTPLLARNALMIFKDIYTSEIVNSPYIDSLVKMPLLPLFSFFNYAEQQLGAETQTTPQETKTYVPLTGYNIQGKIGIRTTQPRQKEKTESETTPSISFGNL